MQQNGIHHVTAIAGPARRNLDFYTRTLGLRLVKKTVNFDDPGTYHLYYGDEAGRPGTHPDLLPLGACRAGARLGVGETQETAFRVPEGAARLLDPPLHRARRRATRRWRSASARPCCRSRDPDGMAPRAGRRPRRRERAGLERRRGPGRARDPRLPRRRPAARGAAPTGADPDRRARASRRSAARARVVRFAAGDDGHRRHRRLCGRRAASCAGRTGGGSVHHIAFRAADDAAQAAMVAEARRRPPASRPRSRRTATISARSTSASRAASCSRSRPTCRASPSTSPSAALGHGAEAAGLPGAATRARSRPRCPRSPDRLDHAERDRPREASDDHRRPCLHPPLRARRPAPARPPLLLLHGTGGDENDLLAARAGGRARVGPALAARQGAGERHAALLPPAGGGRVRRGRPAPPRATSSPTSSPRRARPTACRPPWRSASRTAPTSRRPLLLLRPEALAGAALLRAMVPLPIRRPPTWLASRS